MTVRQNKKSNSVSSRIVRGSGNVFVDLGFSASEARDLQIKAELARQIFNRIKSLGLTQTEAGQRLGIGQPDVSKLMGGRFTGYSTDRLLSLLNALQMDVDIIIRPRKESGPNVRGIVRVREAAVA